MSPRTFLLASVVITLALTGQALLGRGGPGGEAFDEDRFEKEVVVSACTDPMEIDVLPDRRILWIDRKGNLKMWSPANINCVASS